MAVFNPIVITTAGISLLSQAMAGKGTLTFTSVATSTTVIPYNISNIQAMTALSGIVQTVVPVSVVLKTGNVQVSSIFNNAGITNAYTANTIGLYAALGNGAQTLFAVAIATTPDNIPVQNDLSPSNFYYQFNIAISDTSQLTVTVPEDGNLPASVFNQMFPGITAPDQNNDGDALVYNASSGAWGYVNTETVFTTVSGSGEFVSLQKTLADDFKQIQLFGKSVQKPTTGAQLFNINKLKELDDGVEIIDYSTGEMEISQQSHAMLPVRLSDICPNMVEGRTYYLTGETTSNNKYLRVGAKQWNFDEALVLEESDLLVQCNFVCTTQTGQSGEIIYYKDTFKHIMIVEGSSKKSYEVYTGGEAATKPTPEFPLPITSAGNYDAEEEKYEIGIGVTGKNLFDASALETKSKGGVTVTNNEDGSFTVSGNGTMSQSIYDYKRYAGDKAKVLLKPGTLKFSKTSNTYPYFYFRIDYDNKTAEIQTNNLSKTIVVNEEMLSADNIQITSGYYGEINKEIKSGIVTPMLYYVPDNENYEPFKQQLTSLQIPNPLRGIPVDSGGNYTDAEGQQWICDYIDRERGKYVQNVGVYESKGNENWSISEIQSVSGSIRYDCEVSAKLPNKNFCVNNYFKNVIPNISDGTWVFNNNFDLCLRIIIDKTVFEDVDALKTFLQTAYSSGNPVTWYYQLATPTEESLTPDQIAALNLSAYQGITNIGTDTMPQVGMAIESRGFNLAGDLAQNLIDLQSTVRSQGTAITQNETDIENINNVLNSPLVSYNGLLPVVNPSGIYTYKSVADIVYPIGSIYLSVNNINPGTIFGGTWVSWGSGQVPVGVNTSVSQFATVEQTGGEITHTLTAAEMPSHDHSISGGACTTGSGGSHNHTYGVTVHPAVGFTLGSNGYSTVTGDNQNTSSNGNHSHSVPDHAHDIGNTGGGQAHNNLQPYITCYMWKRTA